MDYKEFSNKIKTKYPEYSDMDDRELAQKMVAKYPEYNDITFDEPKVTNTQPAQKQVKTPAEKAGIKPLQIVTPEEVQKDENAALPEAPDVSKTTLQGNVNKNYTSAWDNNGNLIYYDENGNPLPTTYSSRFPDRPNQFVYDLGAFKRNQNKNLGDYGNLAWSAAVNIPGGFIANAGKDVGDTVKGMAQLLGNAIYQGIPFTPISGKSALRLAKGENPLKYYVEDAKGTIDFVKNIPQMASDITHGIKDMYGQKNVDLFNWDDKTKLPKMNFDLPGFAESFYAHPLNLLDLVGAGEIGKVGKLKNLTKGGQTSKFAKNVGNVKLSPKYSENLVYNAGQRVAETPLVQGIVNKIDNSALRPTTDIAADFLGLNPDSRLLGEHGANVRQAKLIDMKNQSKNIAERNAAIAENTKKLSGLSESEAKELVQSIESGKTLFKPESREVVAEKIKNYNYDNLNNNISVTGEEFGKNLSLKDIQKLAGEHYKNNLQGKFINHKELGNITANAKSRTEYTRAAGSDLKYKIAPKLDEIVETADYVATELPLPNKRNNFSKVHKLVNRVNVGGQNVDFLINVGEDAKGNLFYNIDDIIERPLSDKNRLSPNGLDNIITNAAEISTPRMREVKNLLRDKVNANAEAYMARGDLSKETVDQLPINTYASIKYNKPITELSEAEKLDALKDINKMPAEQRPFYVPMMFEDNLRAGDFFANTTKRYKPNELRQRKVGMGLEENTKGSKRIYNPVELANRLDAHRIKMINTNNMINEITENFAKPYNRKTDKLMDGYVEFNPDAIYKFYRDSIDLNETTLRKLDELGNIDTALMDAIKDSIGRLPEDTKEWVAIAKNDDIYQIPKEVAETLTFGKNKKGAVGQLYDMGTAGFKRKVLALSPKWFINNRIGNGIMASLKGVTPDYLLKAMKTTDDLLPETLKNKSMYEAEKTIIGRTGGSDNGLLGKTARFLGGEFIDTSELKGMKKLKYDALNSLAIPGKVMNLVTDKAFAFNQKFENLERKAVYLKNVDTVGKKMMKTTGQNIVKQEELLKYTLDNPDVLDMVMKNVDNTLGDYINMTSVERRNLRKIIPFYSWMRTISRYTLSLAETNPIKANLTNKIMQAYYTDNEDLPEYQKGAINTGFASDVAGKDLLLNYEHSIPTSTFGDIAENPTGVINPFATIILESIGNRHIFNDSPFSSPNYEYNNYVNNGGYVRTNGINEGDFTKKLPDRFWSIPYRILRTATPGLDALERVGVGSLANYIRNGELKPYDALYDTSLGGYNYSDIYKNPKGYSIQEQILRNFLPLQTVGKKPQKVKVKRNK